jgi:hypothetical protein
MANLVQLEIDGQLETVPRDEIPWEQIRSSLQYRLTQSGVDADQAEELADDAVCQTLIESDDRLSEVRAWSDARRNLATIRRENAERVATCSALLEEQEQLIQSNAGRKAIDQRTPTQEQAAIRETMVDERHYRLLLDLFSRKYWLIYPANDARW